MFRHILVPSDGSALSARAAAVAVKLAKKHGARITAFHAIPPFVPLAYMDGVVPYPELYSPKEYARVTRAQATRMLERIARRAAAAKVRCDTAYVEAVPAWEAIVKEARSRRCDLIVMASHGRRGIEGVLLGSETTRVLTHSRIPVLVTR